MNCSTLSFRCWIQQKVFVEGHLSALTQQKGTCKAISKCFQLVPYQWVSASAFLTCNFLRFFDGLIGADDDSSYWASV